MITNEMTFSMMVMTAAVESADMVSQVVMNNGFCIIHRFLNASNTDYNLFQKYYQIRENKQFCITLAS